MTALELITLVTQGLFVGLFVAVLWDALRQPTRARIDTLLLFGSIVLIVVLSRVAEGLGITSTWVTGGLLLLLNVAPFAMIRLVDDFRGTPRWIQIVGSAMFVAIAGVIVATSGESSTVSEIVSVGWFVAVGGYAAIAFAREAGRTRGITQRRMAAIATGAVVFIAVIVVALVEALIQGANPLLDAAIQVAALTSVLAFFLGFAPPAWVRRAWREPDLRAFLERSIHLTSVADDREAITQLQQAAADAFGAPGAAIGIADPDRPVLRYLGADGAWTELPNDAYIAGRAFTAQRRLVAVDATRDDPEHADEYARAGASTVIAAPVTVDGRRIGVLTVYAARAPIFVEDDLWLLELLADQTGILLEARTLATHANDLRAREDAARLKEEFLSAAAHDLRTPLTVVLGQAELIERRVLRDPNAPVDPAGIARMAREARHLRDLVSGLLDAQRLEQGQAGIRLAPANLVSLIEGVRARHIAHGVPLALDGPSEPLVASVDRQRLEQVIENLLDNAFKYGADDQPPGLRVWREEGEAKIAVVDHGAGIPEADRERIFERFYRAKNAQRITDTGMGLGLYICRRIVEEHGGRIWAEPTDGGGTTFVVALPLKPPNASDPPPSADVGDAATWPITPSSGAVADA